MQVERTEQGSFSEWNWKVSGGWVSNAWTTYLVKGNNLEKSKLIPHNNLESHELRRKGGLSAVDTRWVRV